MISAQIDAHFCEMHKDPELRRPLM
jgi:hypothetical protein